MSEKSIKSDIIISYLSMIISLFITFFITKYQVKYLGEDLYGILSLVNSTIGYIAILDLGVGQTLIRYIAKYSSESKLDKINQLAGHSFKVYMKVALVGLIIGIIIVIKSDSIFVSLTNNTIDTFKICFFIALLNVILQIPGATFNAVLSGFSRFKIIKVINIIKSVLRAILIILSLKIGLDIVSIFIVDMVLNQGINIFNYIYMKKKLKVRLDFKPIDGQLKVELKAYSFYVFLGIVTDQIFWKTDTLILGIISTTTVVGVYAVSGQIISQYLMLCSTYSSVFLPKIVKKITDGQSKSEINKFFIEASRYQFMFVGMILVSYVFIGKDFIVLWLGEKFTEAYYYGLVIMISLVIPMFQTTGYQILYALGKHKFRSIVYLFNAILNIVMSIVLFRIIGPAGVAFATALAMALGNSLIINIYYKKVLELSLVEFFCKVCLKTSFVMIITSYAYNFLNTILSLSWIDFIIKGSIANVIYLLGIWFITLNSDERKMYNNIITSKLLKLCKNN